MPGAVSTHAQAGEIDAVRIDAIFLLHLVEECIQSGRRPDHVGVHLRRHHDEGKVETLRRDLEWPVDFHLLDVVPALTASMEEEDERPALLARGVMLWQKELVLARHIADETAVHGDNLRPGLW
jgi:hypothetical protein